MVLAAIAAANYVLLNCGKNLRYFLAFAAKKPAILPSF